MHSYLKYAVVAVVLALLVLGFVMLRHKAASQNTQTTTVYTTTAASTISTSVTTTIGVPKAALQAYWKFDEGSGTSAYDSSGNSYTGTLVNSPRWVTGKTGYALEFNGRDQYVSTAYYGVGGSGARTFTAWIKTSSCFQPVCDVLSYGSEASGMRIEWSVEGNDLGLRAYDSYIVYSAPNLTNGNWHFIAVVIPQGGAPINAQMYEDGQLLGTVTSSRFATSAIDTGNSTPVNIGRMYAGASVEGTVAPNGAAYFNGTIDDLRIYDTALNGTQIESLYNA